jgi:hypothetical protein
MYQTLRWLIGKSQNTRLERPLRPLGASQRGWNVVYEGGTVAVSTTHLTLGTAITPWSVGRKFEFCLARVQACRSCTRAQHQGLC